MTTFFSLLFSGLSLSATYLLVTLGFAFIFFTLRRFDISFAGVYVWAGYLMWILVTEMGAPIWAAIIASLLLAGLLGWLVQIGVVWPMRDRGASSLVILVGTLGVMSIMEAIPLIIYGGQSRLAREAARSFTLGSITIPDIKIIAIVVAAIIFFAARYFLKNTQTGVAIQAVGSNPGMAQVLGIDIKHISILSAVIGYVIGSIGAILMAVDTGITPYAGFDVLLVAFVCALLGGFGSFEGTAIGALIIGLVRVFSGWTLPTIWQECTVFAILFIIIIFRPRGIFGKKVWTAEI